MATTAAEFSLLLEPKLSNIWHDSYRPEESKFTRVFNVRDMPKTTITDYEIAGFGSLQTQNEGAEVTFDEPISGNTKEYNYTVKALAYRITEKLWRGDLYGEVEDFERDLMRAAQDEAEQAAWDIFNNGFGTTNTGFDGLALFSTAHTRLDGGSTQQNRPSTDEALSVSALHNAVIQFNKWLNHRGRPISVDPETLVVPPDLMMTAREILRSDLKPGTANNDDNVIREFGIDILTSKYLWQTSTTAWFLTGDQHDLNWFWFFQPESDMEVEWATDSIKRKVRQAHAQGFGNWTGLYGTDGVA